jgi:hypothetical protein
MAQQGGAMTKTMTAMMTMLTLTVTTPAWADDHDARTVALEKEATAHIEEVEEVSRDVQYHARRLEALATNATVSRWSHYHHLDAIKSLVNESLSPTITRLSELQNQLPEWKQDSIDRMMSSARMLASDASSAFFAKNDDPRLPAILNTDYQKFITGMVSHADALVTTADAAYSYARAHLKAAEAGLQVKK